MPQLHDLHLHERLLKATDALGFSEATDVQAQAIPVALADKDLMVSAKTGSGKTAAFLLPLLDRLLRNEAPQTSTRALILVPTRELALQIQKAFEQLAKFTYIKSGVIIGGEAFKHQVASIRKNPEVLIATPGRLVEHIEKGTVDFQDLEVLVLDEADRMLDMGFSEDMNTIAEVCRTERRNWLFSATLKHNKLSTITGILSEPASIVVDTHTDTHENIVQQIVLADDQKHKEKLVVALIEEEQANKVFIFCKTRSQCQQLGNLLKYKGLNVGFIHGEISQSERKQVMNQFRNGPMQVLVATDVAARGLDIKGVDLVINFTVAQSGDDHLHRIGRTGRAGEQGKAITLVNELDWNLMSSIERYLKLRFEHRKVKGLGAHYKGPKKLKKSGKAAGSKRKKVADKAKGGKGKAAAKKAVKRPAKKPGKRPAKPAEKSDDFKPVTSGDGFGALRRRK